MFLMLLKQVVLLLIFINLVCANCDFEIIGEALFEKTFGFHKLLIPKRNSISLYDGESVSAFCETNFRKQQRYSSYVEILSDQIEINCDNGRKQYAMLDDIEWSILNNDILSCERASDIELYESKLKLDKCEEHSSLVIGSSSVNSSIYAGICYDWNSKDVKYINYIAYKTKNMITPLTPPKDEIIIKKVSKDKKIIAYQESLSFMSQDQFTQGLANLQEQFTLLSNFQFDYLNIMQDVPLEDVSTKYEDILSIIWWRNLRQINWRNFLDLLEQRSKSIKYDIQIGTSGELFIPNLTNGCKTNTTFSIVTEEKLKKTAPAKIWAHLKAVSGDSSDDFVVIGFNSPFDTFSKSSEFLCEDICENIDWMRNLGPTRQMPTLGLIICCHPWDVVDKLDNFPWSPEAATKELSMEMKESKTVSDISSSTTTPVGDLNEE